MQLGSASHFPTFKAKLQLQILCKTDHAFFTCLVAVCALASACVRDGAITNMPSSTAEFVAEPRPELFYVAAEAVFPPKSKLVDADYLRALGLLVLLQFKMDRRSLCINVLGIT